MKIFTTPRCNLNCIYCFKDRRKKGYGLSEIIEKINRARKEVTFSGGESLIRKDILGILKYAKSRNLEVSLQTNGILLNKEILDYIDRIYFVFDTVNFEDWSRITRRGKEDYEKVLKGINLAKQQNKEVYIESLFTKLNYNSLKETREFCSKKRLTLMVMENKAIPGLRYNNSINLKIEEAKKILGNSKNIIYINAPIKNLISPEKEKYYKNSFLRGVYRALEKKNGN